MISFLRGKIHSVFGNVVTIDVQGVGYEVHCTQQALVDLQPGNPASLIVHTEMREASLTLFGFVDSIEKQVFLLLTTVKGVGARSASDILSMIDRQDLLRAIGSSDVTRLQRVKGVGKKTAERIVVELRDKVAAFVSDTVGGALVVEQVSDAPRKEAEEALVTLGFSRRDAEKALSQIDLELLASLDSGEIVREALRFI